jgi:hypothetical protein
MLTIPRTHFTEMTEPDQETITTGLKERGWFLLKPPVLTDPNDLALSLGPIVHSRRTGLPFSELIPYSAEEAPPGSMSSLIGKSAQPMHSDGAYVPTPPRYLLFECIEAGKGQCPTHLWALGVEEIFAERHRLLTTPKWIFGRGNGRGFYGSIVQRNNSSVRARFDPLCMAPASFCHSSVAEAESALKRYAQPCSVDWITGAILIIDNWRCLHARGFGSDDSPTRRLRRWQIGDPNGLGQQSSV